PCGDVAGGAVPFLERAGIRLRDCRDRNHGGDGHDGLCRDLAGLEMVADRSRRADRAVLVPRHYLPRGQSVQGVRRRLGAPGVGRRRDAVDVHVAPRQPAPVREIAQARIPAGRSGGDAGEAPAALMHSLKHYKVLHEKNVILTIESAPTPRIDDAERVRMEQLSETFSRVTLRFGFMESPNVPKTLAIARRLGWQFDIMSTSFFLSRRALKPAAHSGMPRWQDLLFIRLSRSANDATDYFQIP